MHREFFLMEREGREPVRCERLPFGDTGGRDEAWLRDLLHAYPGLIPVKDIDPAYGPIASLCTELRTAAGPLDAAFINPSGRLTLVECKLWRNPQSRREVIAQVLHYAQAISRWSYSDLQREVTASAKTTGAVARDYAGNLPFEIARKIQPELKEHEFVDAAGAAMRSGRFLLLIAGEGIREDVAGMAELINQNASLGFSFGLVEMALYGTGGDGLAIQPRVIAKTRLIERTVLLLRDAEGQVLPTEDTSSTDEPRESSTRTAAEREWWRPVVDMRFDDPDQPPPRYYYPNHVRVPLPWPRAWLLGASTVSNRQVVVQIVEGGLAEQKTLSPLLRERSEDLLTKLPAGSTLRRAGDGQEYFTLTRDWADAPTDEAKRQWVRDTLNAFVNVVRPIVLELAEVERSAS